MKLYLEITMDNTAFEGDWTQEACRLLVKTATKIESQGPQMEGCAIVDINGNKVGKVDIMD